MGRVHIQYASDEEGHHTICCKDCMTPLSHTGLIVSKEFQSSSGRAFLLRKVVNLRLGDTQVQDLLTGLHKIRTVFCGKCGLKVGWFYEMAFDRAQRYKEAGTVLECAQFRLIRPLPPKNAHKVDVGEASSMADSEEVIIEAVLEHMEVE